MVALPRHPYAAQSAQLFPRAHSYPVVSLLHKGKMWQRQLAQGLASVHHAALDEWIGSGREVTMLPVFVNSPLKTSYGITFG